MPINQQAIAERLGISISTVSLALRDAPQVAEETRMQVRAVAEELGYRLRARRPPRTTTVPKTVEQIAMITPYEATNPVYGGVLSGIESECRKHHIALHYRRFDGANARLLAQLRESDGLLLAGAIAEDAILEVQRTGRPIVLIDNDLPHLNLDRALVENIGAFYCIVAQLAAWGHRRIAIMRGPVGNPSFDARLEGYRRAITRLGLERNEIDPEGSLWPEPIERGIPGLSKWLRSEKARDVTALIAMNDANAIAILHAVQAAGLRVPDDLSIVGFDDIAAAQLTHPPLTTCHVDWARIGQQSVRLLLERISHPELPAQAIVQGAVLVERASTRRLR